MNGPDDTTPTFSRIASIYGAGVDPAFCSGGIHVGVSLG